MMNSEKKSALAGAPAGFVHDYDAHIYFDGAKQRDFALTMRESAIAAFGAGLVRITSFREVPVGPHPLPMYEINFSKKDYPTIQPWILAHRGPLTVLLHEVTGYDHRDHRDGATWYGEPLPLDFSRLDPDPV